MIFSPSGTNIPALYKSRVDTMEFAMMIRPMTQRAVVSHVAKIERQKEIEIHLYMEQILPQFTKQFFDDLMEEDDTKTVMTVNHEGHANPVTVQWLHPVIAGIGPGFFQVKGPRIEHGLNGNIDTLVQEKVRIYLRERGWKCWWTMDSFCFQDALDFELVERGMKLFACYRGEGAGDLLLSDS